MKQPELKIWTGDLLDVGREVPDCSVDMVFTSPPYKRKDGFSLDLMEALGELLGRVLRPGGRVYLNFGQLREAFDRPGTARDIVYEGSNRVLEPGQTIAWVKSLALPGWRKGALERLKPLLQYIQHEDLSRKELLSYVEALQAHLEGPGNVLQRGHYQPITMKSPTLNYCWEPIFTFYKKPELALNRLAIGCPFADKTNMKRGTRGKHGDLHCAGDTWWVPYKTTGATKKKATASMGNAYSFPVELVERAIKLSSMAKGCVVLDPFMGSGRSAVAARRLGMHAWGIEIDPGKVPVIQQSWEGAGHEEEAEAVDVRGVRAEGP